MAAGRKNSRFLVLVCAGGGWPEMERGGEGCGRGGKDGRPARPPRGVGGRGCAARRGARGGGRGGPRGGGPAARPHPPDIRRSAAAVLAARGNFLGVVLARRVTSRLPVGRGLLVDGGRLELVQLARSPALIREDRQSSDA